MTWPVNYTRVVHLAPLSYYFILRGWTMFRRVPGLGRYTGMLLLMVSILLNAYHLWGPARRWGTDHTLWEHQRWVDHSRAYDLLQRQVKEQGPGYLFINIHAGGFFHLIFNPAFHGLSYPWNAAWNPVAREAGPSWGAVLTNAHHRKYLEARFPGLRWHPLSDDDIYFKGTVGLAVMPVSQWDPASLERWREAEKRFYRLDRWLLEQKDLRVDPLSVRVRYRDLLRREAAFLGRDPFLRTVYHEKMFSTGLYGVDNAVLSKELQSALTEAGYRSPYLVAMDGIWRYENGDRETAKRLFDEAVRDYPPSKRYINTFIIQGE